MAEFLYLNNNFIKICVLLAFDVIL